eukprot:4080399-Prymnesium_polylepis.1
MERHSEECTYTDDEAQFSIRLDLFTLSPAEWAFTDPSADGVSQFDTWREILGLESFMLGLKQYVLLANDLKKQCALLAN